MVGRKKIVLFSRSIGTIGVFRQFVLNIVEDHQKESFLDEYRKFLTFFDIDWDEQYIFKEPE